MKRNFMLKITPVKFSQFRTHACRHRGPGGLFYVLVMNSSGRDTGPEMYATVSGAVIELTPVT
jgi:hypothetical protein